MHVQFYNCDSSRNTLYRDFSYMSDIIGQYMPSNAGQDEATHIKHKI